MSDEAINLTFLAAIDETPENELWIESGRLMNNRSYTTGIHNTFKIANDPIQ